MRLFRRVYELQVDNLRITGLDVAFSVERTLQRRPGRCEVKVWNLSADHRRQLEALPRGEVYVRLSAGYEDGTSVLFDGRLHRAVSERQGPDIVTTVRSRDGQAAHQARTSRSFAAGTPIGTVVEGLVDDMGVGLGNLPELLPTLTLDGVGVFDGGATTSGSASDELDDILSGAGYEWSVQDGAIQALRRGSALGRTAVRLAPETGLVGSPSVADDGKLSVQALLIPDLVPGRLVRVEAADRQGTYRIEKAVYKGESAGAEWGCELTCGVPA